jgi:hypothetical protein
LLATRVIANANIYAWHFVSGEILEFLADYWVPDSNTSTKAITLKEILHSQVTNVVLKSLFLSWKC